MEEKGVKNGDCTAPKRANLMITGVLWEAAGAFKNIVFQRSQRRYAPDQPQRTKQTATELALAFSGIMGGELQPSMNC